MGKRPIDLKRDAGKGMTIGEPGDPITGFVKFQQRLFVVKAKSVYEIKLADQIDPKRTNIDIPDTSQKVMDHGSDDVFVGRLLLTAAELFKDRYLAKSTDECERCISFSYDASKDAAAMFRVSERLTLRETELLREIDKIRAERGAISLPAIGDVEASVKEFIQKADHILQSLFFIVKIFYPDQKNMFEGLYGRFAKVFGAEDPIAKYLQSNLRFIKTIRRARNAVEHPKDDLRVVLSDFALRPDGTIAPPLITLIDKDVAFKEMSISTFMKEASEQIVLIFESLLAGLCDRHEREVNNIRFGVSQFTAGEQGLSKHVRYAHSLAFGGRITRAQ